MPGPRITDPEQLLHDDAVKLEITGGIPTWEASPSARHQRAIFRIQASIKTSRESDVSCACAHLSDVSIRFPDGSFKRPDISIFCEEPPDQDEALEMVPEAVVEVISPGYEYKDVALNPQFYLSQGVLDVIIVDPRSGAVAHYRTSGAANLSAPVTIDLECGCVCAIPGQGVEQER